MGFYNATKIFRRKADMYLEMIGHVRDERKRRIVHQLFEKYETMADALEKSTPSGNLWTSNRNGRASDCI
jgi:hypothetical protein